MEEWKPIEGYEGLYEVSNMGRVKSLKRTVWDSRGYYKTVPERIMKPKKTDKGYLTVNLSKEGKNKWCYVHRLAGQAFIPNPDNLPLINHKDENPKNNNVDNLEWCTQKYNINYGTHNKRMAEKLSKPIIAIHKINGLILEFPSIMEASRQLGINNGNICACLKGRRKSHGGFYWMYANNTDTDDTDKTE